MPWSKLRACYHIYEFEQPGAPLKVIIIQGRAREAGNEIPQVRTNVDNLRLETMHQTAASDIGLDKKIADAEAATRFKGNTDTCED